MARNDKTSQIIDAILRYGLTPTVLATGMVLPGLLVALDKPLDKILNGVNKREKERELRRVLSYMKWQKLITDNYEYGLKITDKGRERLEAIDINKLSIKEPPKWDGYWRIIFYDIPEKHKAGRNALTFKLRSVGFYQMQKSVWIHPLPCRDVIEAICTVYGLEKYVTYTECRSFDNEAVLLERFKKKLPKTKFSINRAIA
ncbi:MAG: hypothetical protein U5K77_00535 [Candidatus Saccharibacteria bacterium]|nr:hypothetical protein [Candidatus Saccharibacteria bacterium]